MEGHRRHVTPCRAVSKPEGLTPERRGRKGEDVILSARRSGLGGLEILLGLAAGPLAAFLYPSLRVFAKEVLSETCTERIWLCGGVPEALQVFFRSTLGLLFSFLLGYTSSFRLARQEKFYDAMYEESGVLTQLLEEAPMRLPSDKVVEVVRLMRIYLASSTWRNPSFIPAELVARGLRSDRDPVEELTRIFIEGDHDRMLDIVSSLRAARARKFSALQRIIPPVQFVILVSLAVLISLSPFLDGKADSSLLAQCLYGILVEVLATVVIYVAGGPGLGIYSTETDRLTILSALIDLLDSMEAEHAEGESKKQSVGT